VIEIHDGFLLLRVFAKTKEDRMKLDELQFLNMEQLL